MNHRIAATITLAALALTGCSDPGWEGTGTVVELEYLTPELEGREVDHDGLDITVLNENGNEESATVEDCTPTALALGDRVTVADVTRLCGPLDHSTDE